MDVIQPGRQPQDLGKRWIRIELDILKRQVSVNGHIQDKNLAINMLTDAIRIVNNMGTVPVNAEPGNGNGGHSS